MARMTRDKIREHLTGPICTLPPIFHEDGSIDYAAVRNMVDFVIAGGTRSVVLTAGDSLFTILSDQEIADMAKVVVEHTVGRAMVVAADRHFATGQSVAFAKYVREVGADVLMVLPPDWAASCTPGSLAEHYAAVAEYIPVMVVTNVFIPRGMSFGLETLQVLAEEAPGVVAVKDDFGGEFARRLTMQFHEHWAIWAGGRKQAHLDMLPYGCDGYLSTYIMFCPRIAHDYWQAVQEMDLKRATEIIQRYDWPFFDFIGSLTGGFDAGVHGTLELFGVAPRWRRKPYVSLSDEEMERLADFFNGLGLL